MVTLSKKALRMASKIIIMTKSRHMDPFAASTMRTDKNSKTPVRLSEHTMIIIPNNSASAVVHPGQNRRYRG